PLGYDRSTFPRSAVRGPSLEFGDLRASGGDQLPVRVRVACESPSPVRRLGEQHPRALGERWIPRRLGNDRGEPAHDRELLLAVEGTRVRQDLDTYVGAVAIDVRKARRRYLMNERSRVLPEHGDVGDLLDRHELG